MRRAPALALLAAAVALAFQGCARAPERPNVLLITVDTWRADRLSAAGGRPGLTPHLDALAAEGLVFTHVTSPRAKTTPAVASLMTGLYPHEHGARDLLIPLASRHACLAERLRDAGWSTAAIIGNFVLKDDFAGLARGFQSWTEDLPDELGVPPENVPQRTARSLTDGALAALGLGPPSADGAGPAARVVREDRPWFLWLHYMDPHGVYAPPPEFRPAPAAPEWIPPETPRPPSARAPRRWVAEYNVPEEAREPDGRIDARRVRDLYDGEVRYVDAELGRLFARLREAGELERTLVVVTADHGESLGEQDYWFEHGRNVSEATVRVPLVVRWPERLAGRPAPGARDLDLSLCDVAPTLLDLLHLPALASGEGPRGTSRLDAWQRGAPAPRAVFAEKVDRDEREGAVQSKSVRIGDWKWIRRFAHLGAPFESPEAPRLATVADELYDLAADPWETTNLAAAPPPRAPVERLQLELLRFAAADARFPELGRILQEHREGLERGDPETLRILEALGY